MLSDDQKRIRCGNICASSVHKLMGTKGLGKTGESYIWELIAQRETGIFPESYTNEAMQWGIDHEDEAGAYYEAAKGISLEKGESILMGDIVATPDFLYPSEFGIEVKCPFNSAHHSKRLRYNDYKDIKKNNPDYYWQMVCGMFLTGLKKWIFISYDPRMIDPKNKMVAITVPYVSDDMDLLKQRISESIHFMVDKGVKDLTHKHADIYWYLKDAH